MGELERRLTAELHDHAPEIAGRLLDAHDLQDVLGRQRLEVETIRGVVVGRYGLRIAVDHDGLVARFIERVDRMHTAVIEFDPLPDPVGSAAEDDDLGPVGGIGLAFAGGEPVALVARVHVRRERGELRRAGIDTLEYWAHAVTQAAHGILGGRRQLGETRVTEPHRLYAAQSVRVIGQSVGSNLLLGLDDLADAMEEPRIVIARLVNLLDRQPLANRLSDLEDPIEGRERDRGPDGATVGRAFALEALDPDFVQAGQPGLHGA